MKENKDESFWNRTWKSISPERTSAYIENFDMTQDDMIDILTKKKAKHICDAGCGCGIYALKLAHHGFFVSGFDISADAVSLTKKLLSEHGYPADDFKQADVLFTEYEDKCFDAVLARDVIDHMPIKKGIDAVKELKRIVRPGGSVLLTLDSTDSEYESEPHEITDEGDYVFINGKWNGMVFHPYSKNEIITLSDGMEYRIISSDDSGYIVVFTVK